MNSDLIYNVGLIFTTFDDMSELAAAYESLHENYDECPFGQVFVDAGSTDGTARFLDEQMASRHGPIKHLASALNVGIYHWMDLNEELAERVDTPRAIEYIGWVHPDMLFPQKDWLKVLIQILEENPDIGKLGPDNWQSGPDMREGNTCPWLIPTVVLEELQEQDGFCFDPQFVYCGGYEDWDLNRRIMANGRKVVITNQSRIKHEGMVSRNKPRQGIGDYHNAGRINAGKYTAKWGDCDPPC